MKTRFKYSNTYIEM